MQQCAEGWHRSDEPHNQTADHDRDAVPDDSGEHDHGQGHDSQDAANRRGRSTRRRQDAPDLPRVPVEERTVGRTFATPDGKIYRPSMFLTVTLDCYGPVTAVGVPRDPGRYDYRRAALDALHFPKLIGRFWQNLRRCAGFKVQYFAAVEPQRRLVPHLHAALRGAIPRQVIRQVVRAIYLQLWWPSFDRPFTPTGGQRGSTATTPTWTSWTVRIRRTLTGCTLSSAGCLAARSARTGCGTASNLPTAAQAWNPAL